MLYTVRRVQIGKTDQLDALAHACGDLYSQTLVSFWRMVRKHSLWPSPAQMMRWHTSDRLHAHTADACVQAFFAALNSWRARRKTDSKARPPRKRKWYFRIEYKTTAIRHQHGILILSNGKGNAPLFIPWPWQTPRTVVIHWTGTHYEALATYQQAVLAVPCGATVAGVDLGEVHLGVAHDGQQTWIANGRLLRAKRRYQNKLKGKLSSLIDTKKRGSRRRKRLIRSRHKQLTKLKNQIRDIEHKQTSRLVSTLYQRGVQTLVIGDVRNIRQNNDKGHIANQKIHQWSHGKARWYLSYKAERLGMQTVIQEESYTTKTCPACGKRRKSAPSGRVFLCPSKCCRFRYHRDGVGAINIRGKYLGLVPVVGAMAPPIGLRYTPHVWCSSLPR